MVLPLYASEDTIMFNTNDEHPKNLRNPERTEQSTGIARPIRTSQKLFAGWGPALLTGAVTLFALLCASVPASAATKVILASACSTPNHGAALLSHPDVMLPDGVNGTGTTILRVDLAASGEISNIAVAQSSGDSALDFAAMRVARASRYAAASWDCQPAGDSFLYKVIFAQ
ncbi:MAG TPA: energy transducer TonB [Candidatus Baltobacteraceae bacterium]|nr:energy transducer TonB [Candidatus Baltobacteraceae bacterium]